MNSKKIFFFLIFCAYFGTAITPLYSDVNIKQWGKEFLATYIKTFVALLAHEAGHKFTAQKLGGYASNSHHCAQISDKLMLSTDGVTPLNIHNIFPIGGWTNIYYVHSKWKKIATLLAGPLCGAATLYLCNLFEAWHSHKNWSNKKCLLNALFNISLFFHLADNLVPYKENDGALILKEFFPRMKTDGTLFSLVAILSTIECSELVSTLREKYTENTLSLKNKDTIEQGNLLIMQLANKSLATIKAALIRNRLLLSDTDFNLKDLVTMFYLTFCYNPAVKNYYYNI